MKKIVTIGIGCLLSLSLSGCSLGSVIDRFTASDDAAIQDINPEITRVYMDEIRGELQNFTGNQITLLSDNESYTFDISQATLECSRPTSALLKLVADIGVPCCTISPGASVRVLLPSELSVMV